MHPEWRPILGFESAYLVSSEGQVKSVARAQVECLSVC